MIQSHIEFTGLTHETPLMSVGNDSNRNRARIDLNLVPDPDIPVHAQRESIALGICRQTHWVDK